jgi:hypothetical protein
MVRPSDVSALPQDRQGRSKKGFISSPSKRMSFKTEYNPNLQLLAGIFMLRTCGERGVTSVEHVVPCKNDSLHGVHCEEGHTFNHKLSSCSNLHTVDNLRTEVHANKYNEIAPADPNQVRKTRCVYCVQPALLIL